MILRVALAILKAGEDRLQEKDILLRTAEKKYENELNP